MYWELGGCKERSKEEFGECYNNPRRTDGCLDQGQSSARVRSGQIEVETTGHADGPNAGYAG